MSGAPVLVTGSYDRSIRVWSDNTPSRSLAFNASQVNMLAISSDGRFLAAGGHGVLRVYELNHVGPHVSNEGTNCGVDSNYTSVHFVAKPTFPSSAGQTPSVQDHSASILVSTSEDGVVRVWEGQPRGQALSATQSSPPVGCPLLCSSIHAASRSTAGTALIFAGSQAGIIFAWNLTALPVAADGTSSPAAALPSTLSSSSSSSPRPLTVGPVLKLAVNRYPISALSTGNGFTGTHLVAATTRGVIMSFWCDFAAVSLGAVANAQTAAYAGGEAGGTGSGDDGSSGAAGGGGGDHALAEQQMMTMGSASKSDLLKGGGGGDATSDAGRATNTEQETAAAAAASAAIFDGDALPLSTTVPLSVFRFAAIFRGHNRYVVRCNFSPDGRLLATASADCTVKLWRVPTAPAPGAIGRGANSSALTSTSNDLNAVDQMMKLALGASGESMWQLDALVPHQRWVWDCTFSSDSKSLFTCASDNSAWSWSLANGRTPTKTFQYTGHQKPVTCICVYEKQQQHVAPAVAAAVSNNNQPVAAAAAAAPMSKSAVNTSDI